MPRLKKGSVLGSDAGNCYLDTTARIAEGGFGEIRWCFQTVHDWFRAPGETGRAHSQLLRADVLP